MKLLRVTVEGLPLFKEKLDLTFFAQQRVSDEQKTMLHNLFSNIYTNPSSGFIGINASGKTSVLKVISLALGILNNEPINHIESNNILGDSKEVCIETFFYTEENNCVCKLSTTVTAESDKNKDAKYSITNEKLWVKNASEVSTRKKLLDFEGKEPILIRSDSEDFLSNDVSIIIAYNKKYNEYTRVADMLMFTNINILPFSKSIPIEIISFLDPTVESLSFKEVEKKMLIYLKFWEKDEIVLDNPIELNNYLSSGTVKGIITFSLALEVLRTGGYLLIDEIENHFNKEIASTLMRLFMDTTFNKKGGSIIFSTHYPELLDEYDRNDSIYITRNRGGITADNLNSLLTRNDIKKSDAYQSGFLDGTTPSYKAYMDLKKSLAASLSKEAK